MILLIDNYDSFVFNLARYFSELGCETQVVRNDEITIDEICQLQPSAIVLSPGPCTPKEAGICIELVRELGEQIPMLGVCLGHQAIAAAFGAKIIRSKEPIHGQTSQVQHDGTNLFAGLPNSLRATRYHSLIIEEDSLSNKFSVTARIEDGTIMAIEHKQRPIFGVQFHPESVLTSSGHRLLHNFLRLSGIEAGDCPPEEFTDPPPVLEWDSKNLTGDQPLHW